jgi:hypothetical protein
MVGSFGHDWFGADRSLSLTSLSVTLTFESDQRERPSSRSDHHATPPLPRLANPS